MPGFGEGPFGSGSFGEWPWSLVTIVDGIPNVYQEQDEEIGQGVLRALLEGVTYSMDGLRRKIRDYDDLRDPLLAPIEQSFSILETILKTENLGDGTSRVFMSEGPEGDKFDGIRPEMTLIDSRGTRFVICQVFKSALSSEFTDPPLDPATGVATGKHIIVTNVGQASTEFIPFSSGTIVTDEDVSVDGSVGTILAIAPAGIVDAETFTLDDGINPAIVFEFDKVPDGVAGANIAVDISAAALDTDVASAMVSAINAATPLSLSADNGSGASATVTITNTGTGVEGDVVSWLADPAGMTVVQPTGGGPGAFIFDAVTQSDDGLRLAPYAFNVEGSYVDGLDIAGNRVSINWTEGGVRKSGSFTNENKPGGDLADTSVIDFTVGAVATGQIRLYNDGGAVIDADSIIVTYTKDDDPPPEDGEIRAQNILSFLASDVGIGLNKDDPEFLQRSYVNSAHKIWDIKGTDLGYGVLGKYAGYFVEAKPLYKVIPSIAAGLPTDSIFAFPPGTKSVGTITAVSFASLIDSEAFTLDDAVNPQVTFEFDTVPDGVSGGNVVVDISAAVTSIDVANAIVSAINSTGSLNLLADNAGGTTSTITVTNTVEGIAGNVVTWSDTVASASFVIAQPVGGTDGKLFTDIDPRKVQFDEVILDAIDLDLLCSDTIFPETAQAVVVTSAVQTAAEGSDKRVTVIVTAVDMHESFGTEGVFVDFVGATFEVQNFARIDSTSYSFETSSFSIPALGAGVVTWKALKFVAPNTVTIVGVGTDVEDLGRQSVGYTGRRYRITKTFTDPIVASIGNWEFIDSDGVSSYLESFTDAGGGEYEFDIIADSPPATGDANIYLRCEIVTSCDFCAASSLLVRISPTTILNFPEALEGDALGRLIIRLEQMIPGHVRIAAFVFSQGAAITEWGAIAAASEIEEYWEDDAIYSALFDEDEFPADEIALDSAPIIASSVSSEPGDPDGNFGPTLATNENVLEEYLAGLDPLVLGTWTAAGLWHITEYRSSTQFKSFNYGQNDVGRLGGVGAVPPDYDGIAATTISRLISPSFSLLAADSAVVVRFRHYGDVDGTAGEDLVRVEVIRDTGAVLTHTITKTMLGLASGTNGSITTYSEDIESLIGADDTYHLEFVFDTGASPSGAGTGEGWYVDDIEVQVTP